MAETEAKLGFGLLFQVGDGASPEVFTDLLEIYDLPEIGEDAELKEATHHKSPNGAREWIRGLKDGSEFEIMANLVWDATQKNIKTLFDASSRPHVRVVAPLATPETAAFTAIPLGWAWLPPIDDRMTLRARFKISGGVTITP